MGCALWVGHPFPINIAESVHLILCLQSLVKYCKRDDSQLRKWVNDYDEHWGIKIFELVQDLRPHTSPSTHHPPHSHNQLHLSLSHGHDKPHETRHGRISDARIAGPQHTFGHNHNSTTDSRPPPPLNQPLGASLQSFTTSNQLKRSGSRSPRSPNFYMHGQLQSALTSSSCSRGSSGNQSDSASDSGEGNGIRSAASVGQRNDSNHGKGRDQSNSLWSLDASRSGNSSGEPSSRYSGAAAVGSRLSGGNDGGEGGESVGRRVNGSGMQESSVQRSVHPSEGVQSLPSLKASGLLDSWGSPWKTGLIEGVNVGQQRTPNQVSSTSPRRTTPPVANLSMLTVSSVSHAVQSRPHPEATHLRATSTLKAVPVGLPWLAKESR